MIVKIVGNGKWGSKKVEFKSGKNWFMRPIKELEDTPLEVGKEYDLTFENRKTKEGKEYTVITKIGAPGDGDHETKVDKKVEVVNNKPSKLTTDVDKMTKADWAKKDKGIKWLACLKAAAEVYYGEKNVNAVLKAAQVMYNHDPDNEPIEHPKVETNPYDNL